MKPAFLQALVIRSHGPFCAAAGRLCVTSAANPNKATTNECIAGVRRSGKQAIIMIPPEMRSQMGPPSHALAVHWNVQRIRDRLYYSCFLTYLQGASRPTDAAWERRGNESCCSPGAVLAPDC